MEERGLQGDTRYLQLKQMHSRAMHNASMQGGPAGMQGGPGGMQGPGGMPGAPCMMQGGPGNMQAGPGGMQQAPGKNFIFIFCLRSCLEILTMSLTEGDFILVLMFYLLIISK